MMFSLYFKCFLLLFCAVTVASSDNATVVRNEKVETIIDISTQLVVVSSKITVVNIGAKPAKNYLFTIDPLWKNNLSYIEVYDEEKNSLIVNNVFVTDSSSDNFEVVFQEPLATGEHFTIIVISVYTQYLDSYPKTAKQNEKHFLLFVFNVYHYTNYITKIQTTTVYPGHNEVTIVDGEKFKLANDSSFGLHYGPYIDVPCKSVYKSVIHYENRSPFLIVKKLERFVKISHWGYVTVKDQVTLLHSGPKFIGPFERPIEKALPDTRVESILTSLPEHAFDIYVKDEIGLVSSFKVFENEFRKVDVELKPRFVLYGGWKTHYEIGYTVPIKFFVSNSNQLFTLTFPVMDQLFRNMVVEEAKLNFILPEGAFFQNFKLFFHVKNFTQNQHYFCYFMDILCREMISIETQNLVDYHCQTDLNITYSFLQLYLLMKPIIFSVFLYVIFLLFLIYSWLTSTRPPSKVIKKDGSSLVRCSQADTQDVSTDGQNTIKQRPAKQDGKQKKNQSKSKTKSHKVQF